MGNIISRNDKIPKSASISMSNGLTSVFISVLGLSGSRLAQRDDEKRLIVWLLEKDQSAVGIGTVGFHISEMPWNEADFEKNRRFLLSVIDGVKDKLGWDTLDYQPSESLLLPCIEQFELFIKQITLAEVDGKAIQEWLAATESDTILDKFPKCPKHKVFLTCFGCHVCND